MPQNIVFIDKPSRQTSIRVEGFRKLGHNVTHYPTLTSAVAAGTPEPNVDMIFYKLDRTEDANDLLRLRSLHPRTELRVYASRTLLDDYRRILVGAEARTSAI